MPTSDTHRLVAAGVFKIEAAAVVDLVNRLTDDFDAAIDHISQTKGRVIVCGIGKSGIVARKLSATLASTGTPSFFMHPGEAYHGDLGMVVADDVFLAISNSGETDEIIKLLPFLRDNGNFLIALTGNPASRLASASNCHIDVGVNAEACPLQLAPTASTTAAMAMGDAIAISLMQSRNFRQENFARFHPGGSLGRRLLSKVDEEMAKENLPFVSPNETVLGVLDVVTRGKLGLAIVEDQGEISMITDGDIRRAINEFKESVFEKKAADLMSNSPISVTKGTRVEDALKLMDAKRITSLLVIDNGNVVGVFKK
ncbi:MAG: KpsF/GutQ family sugar-phosphate isomerase [Aureliella sp.]